MSAQMDELIGIMREMLKWTKFAGAKEVRNVLTATLDSEQKRLIYNLSDGNNGLVQIAQTADVNTETVRRYWLSWSRQGIVDAIKVQGGQRYKKSFDLEDFGIPVPQPKAKKQNTDESTQEVSK
jgi:hypothetical protein